MKALQLFFAFFRRWAIAVAVVLFTASAAAQKVAQKAAQTAPVEKGFAAFKMARTRYVFNPDRRGPVTSASVQREPTVQSRPNYLAVTGVMMTSGKTVAFFSGSQPAYNKVAGVGATLGKFTVASVTTAQVELTSDGKTVVIPVGGQLPMEGSAPAPSPDPSATVSTTTTTTATTTTTTVAPAAADGETSSEASPAASPATAGATDQNDVMKRMMERRRQQTQ
ncbi:MAG: hypothetical protein QOD99_2530 [Chthoniobacter sp.]|jgi:hypothetical protein|nr:hypothetical protein [Chthoniobacter sp.]